MSAGLSDIFSLLGIWLGGHKSVRAIDPNHRVIRYAEAGRALTPAEPPRALTVTTDTRVITVQEP